MCAVSTRYSPNDPVMGLRGLTIRHCNMDVNALMNSRGVVAFLCDTPPPPAFRCWQPRRPATSVLINDCSGGKPATTVSGP